MVFFTFRKRINQQFSTLKIIDENSFGGKRTLIYSFLVKKNSTDYFARLCNRWTSVICYRYHVVNVLVNGIIISAWNECMSLTSSIRHAMRVCVLLQGDLRAGSQCYSTCRAHTTCTQVQGYGHLTITQTHKNISKAHIIMCNLQLITVYNDFDRTEKARWESHDLHSCWCFSHKKI